MESHYLNIHLLVKCLYCGLHGLLCILGSLSESPCLVEAGLMLSYSFKLTSKLSLFHEMQIPKFGQPPNALSP